MPIPYVFTKTFDVAYPSYEMGKSGEHEGRASGTNEQNPEILKKNLHGFGKSTIYPLYR
jgi:hypothetical protein